MPASVRALDDVVVNAAVFGCKELLWGLLKGCEGGVGISVIRDERGASVARALQCEVNHVLACRFVIDHLRSPDPVGVAESRIFTWQIYVRVCPMYEICAAHQHYTRVLAPPVADCVHVRGHDVVVAVLSSQYMRVANAFGLGYRVRGDHRQVVVQRTPVHGIAADGKSQVLLQTPFARAFEIGKQVT